MYDLKTGTIRPDWTPRRERWPRCGARCKQSGRPCEAPPVMVDGVPRNGRCRIHGGLSTGRRGKRPEAVS